MSKIYFINQKTEYYINNHGWVNGKEYNKLYIKENKKWLSISMEYIDNNCNQGQEDFTQQRWNDEKMKVYNVELRHYTNKQTNKKNVTDKIINIGLIVASNKKNIKEYVKIFYKKELEAEYILKII